MPLAIDDDLSDVSELSSPPASPVPPEGFLYPSPPPSQDADQPSAARGPRAAPASKRRRVALPKERTTQKLDLSEDSPLSLEEQAPQIDLLVQTLQKHRKVVVVAGAGISTSAGSTCLTTPHIPYTTLLQRTVGLTCTTYSSGFPIHRRPV